jgi:hypothetical protein
VKKITDPDFVYVPAIKTDIRKTFERIRKEQKEAKANVAPIRRKANG